MAEKVRVLYVDDEIDLLELGKIFLEAPGEISIETIDSAPSTLSFLERASFDAIISDYQMPGMDGITFLKAVRSKENYIPFIIFTGKGREEVVIDALNAGADFYIQKGGDPTSQFAELSHKVKRAVDQHRADTALRESEERFRFVMHYFPGVLWTVDRDLRFTLYQGSGLVSMGLTPDLVVGMSLFDFYKIADPKQIAISAHTRALQGETVVYEYDLLGHTFWTTVSPIHDHKGNITGAEGIALEITEQRRAEEAFQQANTRLNLLSSIAPHEILNKLATVQGYIDIAKSESDPVNLRKLFFLIREILSLTGIAVRENGEPGSEASFEISDPKGTIRDTYGKDVQ